MRPSGKARLAGVMGWPIAHSRSPLLHGHWLERYGIDGAYVPLAVRPSDLRVALRALPALGIAGVNVTVPHKEAALGHLDGLDEIARRLGAVNTVVVAQDGRLEGRNSDGFGFMANLRDKAPAWRADAGPAVMLGAGGAARAIGFALVAAGVPELRIANRTPARAAALARDLGVQCRVLDWSARAEALADAALLVNATSLGMAGQAALELDLERLATDAVVDDIVYAPLETELLEAARARGNVVVDGLGMLLHQARPAFRAFFGVDPEVTAELRRVMEESLA
ncbi:MAG: shikimate dehydrogenase [Alphaproteobacteria bacterium]